ncbi:DNA cytosine methyltransferase [Solibacillus sp. FSL R7-0682]|uniref:DNA cytosine methyltransferase n=1 Tax=Solibacillus sp. FSL R7-0682 TaxID=2921690 RepID=UPI0030F7E2E7
MQNTLYKTALIDLYEKYNLDTYIKNNSINLGYPPDNIRVHSRSLGVWLSSTKKFHTLDLSQPIKGSIQVVDFFSGCGGISSGFKAFSTIINSFEEVCAIDNDIKANSTFKENLGLTPLELDINTLVDLNSRDLYKILNINPSKPLLIIGCAPCQGFSAHSKKLKVTNDTRNTLVGKFANIAKKLNPDFIVMENVPELLSKKYWSNFEEFETTFLESGYNVRARVYNMADFGIPQARHRSIVLASKRKFLMPEGFLKPNQYQTVRDAIGHLPPIEPGIPSPTDPFHVTAKHQKSTIETIKSVPKNGGNRPIGSGPQCLDKVKGFSDVYGRLSWDKPAITMTNYARNPASGRFVHPEQDRGLSVREVSLIQGFPQNYKFLGNFDEKYRQIGNSVPPRFATYLAAFIFGEILSEEPTEEQYLLDCSEDINFSLTNTF